MLDVFGSAPPERASFDSQLVASLNKLDFHGAQKALVALIKEATGVRSSWSSPQYATSRAIQSSIKLDHNRNGLLTFFALDTLRDRYFLRGSDGTVCETAQDFFARVATGVACADKTEQEVAALPSEEFEEVSTYAQKLYDVLSQLHALFATPILTNAGTNRGHLISCLTGEMLISTPDGFYPIKDLEVGNKVLTHKGRWRNVLAKNVKNADDVYSLVVDKRRTSIEITGNHPVLTERGWVRVDQLDLEKDKVAINWKVSDEVISSIQKLDFTAYCPYVAEVRHLEGVGSPVISALSVRTSRFDKQKSRWRGNVAQPIASVDIDEDVAWALGLWFAEGSLGIDHKKQPNAIRITVGHDEGHLAERWIRIMKDKFNITGSMYEQSIVRKGKNNRWISVTAPSKAVACYFAAEFGTSCKEKSLPGWFHQSPYEVLDSFLTGFLDGDGCEHVTGNTEYNTVGINNPTLMGSLYNITLKLGMDVSLKLDKKAGKLASRPTVQEMRIPRAGFMANVPKRSLGSAVQFSSILSLSKIEGSHKVYDIQVEEDESFTVAGVVVHNCFLNESDDNIRDIFSTYEENAVLAQGGGGIGTYWGRLRSQGAKLSRGGKSSGPLPFLKVFDSATLAVHQAGARRGAAAAYIDVSHPDIEDFVDMRRPEGAEERRCQNVHHGISLSDAFMQAVKDRLPWDLVDPQHNNVVRTVDAYGLWKRIVMTRVMTGEPYMLFIDTVNRTQPQAYKDKNLQVKTSNLCAEISLPTKPGSYSAGGRTAICCLGSINYAKYEEWKNYGPELHYLLVRGLDNVLEHFIRHAGPGYEKAVQAAKNGRDIGLGAMGWFDYLQQRCIPFESIEARAHNRMRFKEFGLWSDNASLQLAKERGAAPDGGPYRNVNRQAIAPTATIGIIAGASPSIEPPAGNVYRQETLSGKYIVRNPALEALLTAKYASHNNEHTWQSVTETGGSVQHLDWMEEDDRKAFKTAYEINQREIVQQAADRQPYISQSQSLNLFFAPGSSGTLSASYLHEVHFMAWELGVKSLYYCRSESVIKAANTSAHAKVQQIMDTIAEQECTVCQ